MKGKIYTQMLSGPVMKSYHMSLCKQGAQNAKQIHDSDIWSHGHSPSSMRRQTAQWTSDLWSVLWQQQNVGIPQRWMIDTNSAISSSSPQGSRSDAVKSAENKQVDK